MPAFDFKGFLEKEFGRPSELRKTVKDYGLKPPPLNTVIRWYGRASVSAPWMAILISVGMIQKGEKFRPEKYVRKYRMRAPRASKETSGGAS
jgi:hypothetical protein